MMSVDAPLTSIEAADLDLARLLARVAQGAEILVTQQGVPVARVSPYPAAPRPRVFGALRGQAHVPDAFFEPLPDADLAAWEGR